MPASNECANGSYSYVDEKQDVGEKLSDFLNLLPPQKALEKFLAAVSPYKETELIATENALGRVTSETLYAEHSLPAFPRTTVDGYVVRSKDTHGSSASMPGYLELIGEILMGVDSNLEILDGQCALIHTGGMVPKGADAAIMLEETQIAKDGEIEILKSVAVGENVINQGEDIETGNEILAAGKIIRAAEIGALMAMGIKEVRVNAQLKIGIISSGDELIPPEQEISFGKIRDINSYTLSAQVSETGSIPIMYGIVPDDPKSLLESLERAISECQMVIVTAGSSASARDHTANAINKLGSPGVIVHGINLRPGKPTILGICSGIPIMGLPGNPVSAFVVASIFLKPIIEKLLGIFEYSRKSSLIAKLSINLASQSGREDWVPVRLIEKGNEILAEPIFGKSNLIFTLVQANAMLRVEPEANGLAAGAEVQVFLL